jgi:hypothetical protein
MDGTMNDLTKEDIEVIRALNKKDELLYYREISKLKRLYYWEGFFNALGILLLIYALISYFNK